jgi:hypothetical protein
MLRGSAQVRYGVIDRSPGRRQRPADADPQAGRHWSCRSTKRSTLRTRHQQIVNAPEGDGRDDGAAAANVAVSIARRAGSPSEEERQLQQLHLSDGRDAPSQSAVQAKSGYRYG